MSEKILIVDNDEDFWNSIAKTLIQEGFELMTVSSGNEAIDYIESEVVDVIMMTVLQ